MQGKTINAEPGETRKVTNEWAAQAEARGTTVTSSTWEASGDLTLGASSLSGTAATVLVAVAGSGTLTNTVVLANGETLSQWRDVAA